MPFPRPVPTAVRQTMQRAFEDLEKVITPQDSKDYHDCSLERVRLEALQIENQLGSRGWLRNMRRLKPLFTGLEHYSKVVDILCNGTPFLPWVWAPITFILRIASEHIESFDSLIGAYGRIGSSLQRFEILHKSFLGDPRFHETAAAFYADILEFHKHAYKFVRRSGWKLLFSTTWGKFQRRFGNILEDLKRHEDLIDRLVNTIDIVEARQLRQEVSSWRQQSLQKISLEDKEQSAKEFQAIQSWLRVNECDQLAIFESAAAPGSRFPGTCVWVLNNAKIRSWLEKSPHLSILWLSGVAGSGKSVISSQLINFIRSRNDIVLYHFCTNLSVTSSEYEQVLKSLLEQLLRQDGDLTANVYNSYVLTKKVASVPILEQLLLSLLITSAEDPNQHSYIWIVLDGVNELRDHSPNSQARLLNFVKQIVSKTAASENITCKAFISCRPSKTFSHILRQKPTVSLTDEKKSLGSSIQEYALQRLRSLETRFQQLGLTALEIEDIGQQIAVKSDGMFLYARLVLDFVSSNIFVRGDELRNSISQLPRELSSFYLQLLSQILAPLDENSKRHIECIFGWVAYARRPLRRSELLSAVGFSSGDPDTEFPAPQYILDVCRTLIEERRDTTLTFIHVSVKEFLQSSPSSLKISEKAALHQHCIASIACLLSSMKLLDQYRQQSFQVLVRGVYGLQIYAAEYWTEYLLSIVDWNGGLDRQSMLYNLLCQLSTAVDTASQDRLQDLYDDDLWADKRLNKLKEHQGIYKNVRKAILARSLKQLEQRLRIESSSDVTKQPPVSITADGVSALLPQYQNLLLHIMDEVDVPGVSSRDLEAFRSEYSTSVHTCRLRTCPRATLGFETKEICAEHEKSHVQRYPCTRTGCQYPPFLTPGSLKAHVRKEHDTATPPRSIRRVKTTAASPDTLKGMRRTTLEEHEIYLMHLEQQSQKSLMTQSRAEDEGTSPGPELSHIVDGLSSEKLDRWTDLSSTEGQDDPDHHRIPRHQKQENKRRPVTARQTKTKFTGRTQDLLRRRVQHVFSSDEPDRLPVVDRIWERSVGHSPLRSAEPSDQALQDHQMELMRLEHMMQAHNDSSSGITEEPSSVEVPVRIPLPSSAESPNHAPQDYQMQKRHREQREREIQRSDELWETGSEDTCSGSQGPSSPNFDGTSSPGGILGIPNTLSYKHRKRLRSPPLHSHRRLVEYNEVFERERNKSPSIIAIEDEDEIPDSISGHGSGEPNANIAYTSPFTAASRNQQDQQKQKPSLEASRDQQIKVLAQQVQQVPKSVPTATSAHPDQAAKATSPEKLGYNPRGPDATSTTTDVSQQSIPTSTSTAMIQQNSQHSQIHPFYAADKSPNAVPRKSPEWVGRASPSNASIASSYWSIAEMNDFPELLRSFGTDWQAIATHMTTKTAQMVKEFYHQRKSLEWLQIIHEARAKLQSGQPLPVPPAPTVEPRNKRSDYGIHRRAL